MRLAQNVSAICAAALLADWQFAGSDRAGARERRNVETRLFRNIADVLFQNIADVLFQNLADVRYILKWNVGYILKHPLHAANHLWLLDEKIESRERKLRYRKLWNDCIV